jgi:hypothetical protein
VPVQALGELVDEVGFDVADGLGMNHDFHLLRLVAGSLLGERMITLHQKGPLFCDSGPFQYSSAAHLRSHAGAVARTARNLWAAVSAHRSVSIIGPTTFNYQCACQCDLTPNEPEEGDVLSAVLIGGVGQARSLRRPRLYGLGGSGGRLLGGHEQAVLNGGLVRDISQLNTI